MATLASRAPRARVGRPRVTAGPTLGALGVVFGDIGTSHVLHEQVVIVTARSANVPRIHPEDRVTVDDLGYTDDDITHVTARFGFQEEPDIPDALRLATARGLECDIDLWQTPL